MEKNIAQTTEQDERDWRVAKLMAEIESIKMPYFRKPASWITLVVAIMGVIGTVGQWFNYRASLNEARNQTLLANIQYQQYRQKSEELDAQIKETEQKLLTLKDEENEMVQEIVKQRSEIAFFTEQRNNLRAEINNLQSEFTNIERIAKSDPERVRESLEVARQSIESAYKESSRDWGTENPSSELLEEVLGPPDKINNFVNFKPPYEMYLAWKPSQKIRQFKVHPEALPYFEKAFDLIESRGLEDLAKSYGGALNIRKVRGGQKWSVHSWGIAIDIDPNNNRLKWGPDKWKMDERVAMAFEEAGFFWMGRLGFEAMHFSLSTTTIKAIAKKKGIEIDEGAL